MKKNFLLGFLVTLAMGVLVFYNIGHASSTSGVNESISQIENEINENESRYAKIEADIKALEDSKEDLANYIANLNTTYNSIMDAITSLENQINDKNTQIEQMNINISESEKLIDEQYADMSLRIQFMYENNSMDILNSVLGASNVADVVNRVTYIKDIVSYDRDRMNEIEASIEECKMLKEGLITEQANLEKLKSDQNTRKAELENLMAQASANISAHQDQIEQARATMFEVLEQMEAQRDSVEALKEEESRRQEEASIKASQEAAGITTETIPYDIEDQDMKLMTVIIYCESGNQPYEGQVAVGTVVMNRVESSRFPNSVEAVISSPYQFTPYGMAYYYQALESYDRQDGLIPDSCYKAAKAVLYDGVRSGSWLFFRTVNGIVKGDVIGAHVFY